MKIFRVVFIVVSLPILVIKILKAQRVGVFASFGDWIDILFLAMLLIQTVYNVYWLYKYNNKEKDNK